MEEHSKMLDELVPWATPDDDQLPDVELNEGDVEADRARVRQQENEKRTQEREARERRVQDSKSARKQPGGKFFFSTEDRKIVKNAFLFALDKDGIPKATITSYPGLKNGQKSDFHRAYTGDQVFREMVDRIMEEREFDMKEMKTKVMNTYRALHRENPGNSSASTSGAGKGNAKSSKGGSSKAKRRKRVVESESEESDESSDSEDFSDEESE